ncbi:DUF4097 family beta strand repeat-containing protein [Paenactinomyces guangxiensis]|nr:DUF4097 family beta strand repeat-containing protein [Paenactinomyces guangxiensis]
MMKKGIGLLLIIGGFFILLGSLAYGMIGGWLPDGWFANGKHDDTVVPASKIKRVRIEAIQNLNIIPEDRKDIRAVLDGDGANGVDLQIRQNGSELQISMEAKWYQWLRWFRDEVTLNVYVPQDYNRDMSIKSVAGNLRFYGPSNSRPMVLHELTLSFAAGNVDLQNLKVNRLKYDSTASNMDLQHVKAETADLDSQAGNIQLNHFTGSFRAHLTAGNIHAQIDSLTGPVRSHLAAGNISLDLPQNADFNLDASTTAGEIRCQFPHQSNNSKWNETANATNGNGKHSIKLTNTGGNIHVY